jgi:hypothetical protein
MMELHRPEPKKQPPAQKVAAHTGQQPSTSLAASAGGPETAPASRVPLNLISQKQALQTLVQPDAPQNLITQEIALPQVLVWSSRDIKLKEIVPPSQQPIAEIEVRPSLDPPIQELRVADLKISPSPFDTKAPSPAPSTTSPVSAKTPQQAQRVPETTSKDSRPATPASVISLSNIQLQEGTAALPMVSEVAPAPFTGSLTAGQPKSLSQTGHGKTASNQDGENAGPASGDRTGAGVQPGSGDQPGGASVANGSAGRSAASGLPHGETGTAADTNQHQVTHITLPKDGKFGVVVVGSSLTEDYPETVHLWSGRLAYSVYLHVGSAKNWILQYSLLRLQGTGSANGASRPDAPWPYDITRPSIDADSNSDAIMVHGFVNTAGRFEQLAVIFPTELAETKFLLHALQQWQFRPAMQNGQATAVEVLLIIPDETE